jgi:hypothetical protein
MKPKVPVSNPGVFVMNNYTCSRVMAVYIYYYQYNLYMYDLCIFIRYLAFITQVPKDTGLDNWCQGRNLFNLKLLFNINKINYCNII